MGHSIPAAGSWPFQPATRGTTVVDTPPSGKEYALSIDAVLEHGWHSVQIQIFTEGNSHPKCVTWFFVE
jgi:hypothetical protein